MTPYPSLKRLIYRLPDWAIPRQQRGYGCVVALDENTGNITASYQDTKGWPVVMLLSFVGEKVSDISGVVEHDGYLYLSTYKNNFIAKYKL